MIEIKLDGNHTVLIDDEDADLAQYEWGLRFSSGSFYAYARSDAKKLFNQQSMHRIILERKTGRPLTSNELCDHVHGKTLDNRRSELRIATHEQNRQNRRMGKNNTTGYKGVCPV